MEFLRRLFSSAGSARPEPKGDPLRIAEVETVLAELRPMFLADGGNVIVIEVESDGTVHLQLEGACSSCSVSEMTLHDGIEPRLRERCSWVTRLLAA